jgi:pyruvate dehydrogenase E1 component alpha subunit
MPRDTIDLDITLDRLSILGEDGGVDEELVPDLSGETLLAIHRTMLLARRFDDRMLKLHGAGKLGTFAPVRGQEAAQVGAAAALERDDWMVPAFREIAAFLWRGIPMWAMLIYNAGYNEGGAIPEDHNDLPIAIPVASQIPHAAGIAYALKARGTDRVALTFFGDGATSEGDFHEALNFAEVFRVPVIFLCQNNQWAISVPREHQTRSKTLAQKAVAYGMPALQVDGNDVLATYVATREAVERARAGEGPTMIEAVTYRLGVHTTVDDPSVYRDEEEVEEWRGRDPIPRFQSFLMRRDVLSEDDISELEGELDEEISTAWREAEKRMDALDDPTVIFDHVWEEMPAFLETQREDFERALRDSGSMSSDDEPD